MTTTLSVNHQVNTSTANLTRAFIVLKNKQLRFLSPKEAIENSRLINSIKRELQERGIEIKTLV